MAGHRSVGRRSAILIGSCALLGGLSGCGFHPIYATGDSGHAGPAASDLAAVEVAIIPDRNGQILRQALQERLERSGITAAKLYQLSVAFALSSNALGIRSDSSPTYIRYIARGDWILRTTDSPPKVVTSGTARAMDGSDVIDEQVFAQDLSAEEAAQRLANALADQISVQLATYFDTKAKGSSSS